MTFRTRRLYLLVPVLLALSACSTAVCNEEAPSTAHGAIEFALSEVCREGSDSQCVSINGESIILPSSFERAGVKAAVAVEGEGQNAIDVTFSDDGAAILHTLTEQAAGGTSRLVMKIGDEMIAAVVVAEPLAGEQLQIVVSPDDDAQEIVNLIQGD